MKSYISISLDILDVSIYASGGSNLHLLDLIKNAIILYVSCELEIVLHLNITDTDTSRHYVYVFISFW